MKINKITTKPCLKVDLKLIKDRKVVYSRSLTKLNRFSYLADAYKWDKAYLKVTYKPDVLNEGWYLTRKDLMTAKRQFTEKDLVTYAFNNF